jgi:hypothetical protein
MKMLWRVYLLSVFWGMTQIWWIPWSIPREWKRVLRGVENDETQRFLKSSHSKSYQHVAKTSLFYNDPDQLPWELCRQSYITPGKNGSRLETKRDKKVFRNQISQSAANLAWWFLNMGLLWLGNRFSLGVPPWKST